MSEALSRIVSTRVDGSGYKVSMPVLYPNGNAASVEISPTGDNLFISDMGLGHLEAEYAGASAYYDAQAKRAAESFGISYDGYSVFLAKASFGQLEAAVLAVANASVQATALAIAKSIEDKDRRWNDEVFDRVREIFSASSVSRSVELAGSRDRWPAHNVVSLSEGRRAVFEFVSSHQNSISNKFMMFSDLANSGQRLSLNSVVTDLGKFSATRGSMLADISNIVELKASNDQFVKMANITIAA